MESNFNFEKLVVYQKALNFVNITYDVTLKYLREERFVMIEQFRRAAISISLNIAEGYGTSNLEFKRYLKIAKESTKECIALITLSKIRGYIDLNQERILRDYCVEIAKMLSGLLNSLNQ